MLPKHTKATDICFSLGSNLGAMTNCKIPGSTDRYGTLC